MAETDEDQDTSYGAEHEYRIALIGPTGSGKSATGNNILGKNAFKSTFSGSSVTKKCEFHTAERFGKKLLVVDTPGLFDTNLSNEVITKEIMKCIALLIPGPHAFILVVQVGRFIQEERDIVNHFSHIFGEEFYRYLIVLFTRRDALKQSQTIHEYVEEVPNYLKEILRKCGDNYLAFDNSKTFSFDVLELIRMVQHIMNETGKSYFSNDIFEKAELEFQRRARESKRHGKENIEQQQKKRCRKRGKPSKRKLKDRNRKLKREESKWRQRNLNLKKRQRKMQLEETLQKQETLRKEIEAKKREIENTEVEKAKYELRKKLELEEEENQYREELKKMRDEVRQEYESENKTLLGGILDSVKSVGQTVLGWIPSFK